RTSISLTRSTLFPYTTLFRSPPEGFGGPCMVGPERTLRGLGRSRLLGLVLGTRSRVDGPSGPAHRLHLSVQCHGCVRKAEGAQRILRPRRRWVLLLCRSLGERLRAAWKSQRLLSNRFEPDPPSDRAPGAVALSEPDAK